MVKVIGFSLWGDNPTYTIGAIKNAELAKEYYPDFECWFYIHEESVPSTIIQQLCDMHNVKIILKYGDLTNYKPLTWRFEPIDDPEVELLISRDTDTRILLREKLAVDEWLQSDKVFHIMRDHPHHSFVVLAGMFGTRKIPEIPSWKNEMDKYTQGSDRMYDQDFLRDIIYPLIENNSVIHANFYGNEPHSKKFPIKYDAECRFVGEYVYHDESRSQPHIDALMFDVKHFGDI